MDQALLVGIYEGIKVDAATIGVTLSVDTEARTFNLEGMGINQDQARAFGTIQDLKGFVDGFTLGFQHPRT